MAVPDVETVVLRVGNEMDGVAVAHAGIVESAAIVVHGHGAIGYLVVAVAVKVGNIE